MQALDTTIVNTAIPAMAHHLNEDPLRMHSVVVAYVLSVAACIPLSGWLADRFGVRNTFLSAIIIFRWCFKSMLTLNEAIIDVKKVKSKALKWFSIFFENYNSF